LPHACESTNFYNERMRLAALLLLLFTAVGHSAAPSVLTSGTYWDWRSVSSPDITRDGSRVVYVLGWQDKFTDANYSHLWLVSSNGQDRRPLTQGNYRDSAPAWSPDGRRIAFLSNRSGKNQIHVRWVDGSHEAVLTDIDPAPLAFSWSPDGRSIAYLARVPGKPDFSVKLEAAPAGTKWAEPASVVTRLKWRADRTPGQGLVPYGETHLFVIPADGGGSRRVTPEGYSLSGRPDWSPDSRTIVFTAQRVPQGDRELYPDDLYSVTVADGELRRLTTAAGPEGDARISPDGRRVAFLGFVDKGNASHTTHLYVQDLGGAAELRQELARALDRNISSARWRADGRALYGIVEDQGKAHLYEFTLDGGARQLTEGNVRWVTGYAADSGFALSHNGVAVMGHSAPNAPRDLAAVSIAEPGRMTMLTDVNRGVLDSRTLGDVEEIRYKSFDGRIMQGWIIKPPGFDSTKKYPMILDIHGGPHAMYGVEFNWQMQVHAARGFVVLYTNPRGSTGYGEEFGNVIHGKYPGDDYQDLMAGVDALIAKGYVDPARLFITGGSGGGILAAWIVTQTDRFRAAVSQYPVINWITQGGSSDIPLVTHRWMKSTPWENPQQYLSRSPLSFADKVKTPTMLLTGEEDWRTPIAQTEEFYVALKTRGVDTAMIRFPKEPHGVRGAFPSHWVAKVEYILGWFEHHGAQAVK